MKYVINLLAIIFLVGINAGVFPYLKVFGASPNLLILLALLVITERRELDYLFVAFVCGLFLDFFSGAFFGTFTLAILLASFLLNLLIANWVLFFEINWKNLCLILLVFFTVVHFFAWIFSFLALKLGWSPQSEVFGVFSPKFIYQLLYNFAMLYPMYWFTVILRKINLNFEPQNQQPFSKIK